MKKLARKARLRNETSVGKFEVELRAKKNGQNVSFKRSIAVGEVSSTESEFALEAGGSYKNDTTYKFWAKPPELNEALYMKGKVKLTAQSPALSKIQWGFVQGAKWDTNLVLLPPDEVAGKPKYLYQQSVPVERTMPRRGDNFTASLNGFLLSHLVTPRPGMTRPVLTRPSKHMA